MRSPRPPGWSIELVAQSPQIVFPTAVVAAPDGSIYIGSDPMDMPGPPTEPIDRVLQIKNGRTTVFADKLWSVMGLEWVDGMLYVVHAPSISPGVPETRTATAKADFARRSRHRTLAPSCLASTALTITSLRAFAREWTGSCTSLSAIRGIPQGRRPPGWHETIRLHGGGVIRVPTRRDPDWRSSRPGERNPLSVALSAADDVFTYGNDDDSRKWPNSLTHHIAGGHYGYPYQFLTAPHRASHHFWQKSAALVPRESAITRMVCPPSTAATCFSAIGDCRRFFDSR